MGRALRDTLATSFELLCVDRVPTEARPGERAFQIDLGYPEQIDRLFELLGDDAKTIRAVVHLAAYYDFSNRPDPRYERLEAALPHLLEQLDAHTPADAPIIYASSMAALAPTEPGHALGPDAPRVGQWAYPRHKLNCETTLEASGTDRSVVELVLAGVYSDAGELVPLHQQIKRIANRSIEAMFYPGPVNRGLTYVHIEDTAAAFARAVDTFAGTRGERARLMIGEETPVTYAEIHSAASKLLHGRVLPLLRVPRFIAWLGAVVLFALAQLLRVR
ncbi:MAG: NAD(P)-dependent oxidoreductase, partial [Myxococcota bacterium]